MSDTHAPTRFTQADYEAWIEEEEAEPVEIGHFAGLRRKRQIAMLQQAAADLGRLETARLADAEARAQDAEAVLGQVVAEKNRLYLQVQAATCKAVQQCIDAVNAVPFYTTGSVMQSGPDASEPRTSLAAILLALEALLSRAPAPETPEGR